MVALHVPAASHSDLGAGCVRRAVVDARVCAEKLLVVVVAAIAAVLAVSASRTRLRTMLRTC